MMFRSQQEWPTGLYIDLVPQMMGKVMMLRLLVLGSSQQLLLNLYSLTILKCQRKHWFFLLSLFQVITLIYCYWSLLLFQLNFEAFQLVNFESILASETNLLNHRDRTIYDEYEIWIDVSWLDWLGCLLHRCKLMSFSDLVYIALRFAFNFCFILLSSMRQWRLFERIDNPRCVKRAYLFRAHTQN